MEKGQVTTRIRLCKLQTQSSIAGWEVDVHTFKKGHPLSADHPIFNANEAPSQPRPPTNQTANLQIQSPPSVSTSRHGSSPSHAHQALPPPSAPARHIQQQPVSYGGPGYANLPSHGEDIRRLMEECTAAQESARLLGDALVYTRPEELDYKPVIRVSNLFGCDDKLLVLTGCCRNFMARFSMRMNH